MPSAPVSGEETTRRTRRERGKSRTQRRRSRCEDNIRVRPRYERGRREEMIISRWAGRWRAVGVEQEALAGALTACGARSEAQTAATALEWKQRRQTTAVNESRQAVLDEWCVGGQTPAAVASHPLGGPDEGLRLGARRPKRSSKDEPASRIEDRRPGAVVVRAAERLDVAVENSGGTVRRAHQKATTAPQNAGDSCAPLAAGQPVSRNASHRIASHRNTGPQRRCRGLETLQEASAPAVRVVQASPKGSK
ncbi:hypothetical protein BCR34DRAFT_590301 [Clohesyomyces aquaticus]|uniref:Uncharacterized protein n=1 Tax=Clohesyomyces aquaticus TaxID=1231657 RepID=A0A1Y1ZAT6_9PLEO|nr:hypothetical protein BCR34DRAFT_590301 [Clohesyomyces aquaticus]